MKIAETPTIKVPEELLAGIRLERGYDLGDQHDGNLTTDRE